MIHLGLIGNVLSVIGADVKAALPAALAYAQPTSETTPLSTRVSREARLRQMVDQYMDFVGRVLRNAGTISTLKSYSSPACRAVSTPPVTNIVFSTFINLISLPRKSWVFVQNRLHIALLCGGAGIVFGLVESAAYVWLYAPDHPDWYPWFRFTVPVGLHAIASFTVGLGLDWRVVEWVNQGTRLPRRTRNSYIAGVLIHATYNTAAAILALSGVFDF